MNCLIKSKAVRAHISAVTSNRIAFAVHTVSRAFKSFARAAGVGSVAEIMLPNLRLDNSVGDFRVL